MPSDSILLDPVSELATNAQLELNDGVSYFLLSQEYPEPGAVPIYASSADTEGKIPVSQQDDLRVIPYKLRTVGTSALDLDQRLNAIEQKIGKFKREGGTLKRTTPSGLVVVFDVLPESGVTGITFDKRYLARWKSEVDLRFTCLPYGRGTPVDTVLDDFSTDTIGNYTFQSGGGTLSVSGGQLVPSSTATKVLYRTGKTYSDVQLTMKFTTGASVASASFGLTARRLDDTTYLRFRATGASIAFDKLVSGSSTALGSSVAAVLSTNTTYWLRFRLEGSKLTGELWTSAPTATGTPSASTTYTLAGANATTFGQGIAGEAGMRFQPTGTDERYDDFQIDPYVYVETTNPVLVTPPIYGIKGDVPALATLRVNELASFDQWWALWGNESRYFSQGVPTILDQFGTDTIGTGAWAFDGGSGTIAVSGGQLVPSDTTVKTLYRTDSASYSDLAATLKFTTGAAVVNANEGITARRADANNLLLFRTTSTQLAILKNDGGSFTSLASVAIAALATTTSYWLRATLSGKTLAVERYTADPATGAAATASVSYTLTDAEFAKYARGQAGLRLQGAAAGTDYRYDDFRVQPLQGSTACLIDSEDLIVSGYSGTQTTRGGAFSGGTVANHVIRHTLANAYAASCATPPLGHVGSYRVFARLYRPTTNSGAVSVALEWGVGDLLRITRNTEVTFAADEREGDFTLTDLGRVEIPPATKGTQQWQGRIIAKSTVLSDVLDIDYLVLVPYAEGSGEASGVAVFQAPASLPLRDEFDQTAGNLNAKVLPVTGSPTWATSGSATDLAVDAGSHIVSKSAIEAARYAIAGTTTFTDCLLAIDLMFSAGASTTPQVGLVARWTDASNHLRFELRGPSSPSLCELRLTSLAGASVVVIGSRLLGAALAVNAWYTMWLLVTAQGQAFGAIAPQGVRPNAWMVGGSNVTLAPGGTLATGKTGFVDNYSSGPASTRSYDNFWAGVPVPDAALFAGRQMEFRHDSMVRQDSSGSLWSPVSDPEGDYVKLVPAGRENRQNRIVIDTCRNDPTASFDPSLSKTQLQVVHVPRYLSVPSS